MICYKKKFEFFDVETCVFLQRDGCALVIGVFGVLGAANKRAVIKKSAT